MIGNDSHSRNHGETPQKTTSRRLLRRIGAVAIAVILAACGSGDAEESSGLVVVATTDVLGSVITELVGDDGAVEVLIGAGVDPHSFSPSASQVARIHSADLVVANGLRLEEGLVDVLATAETEGANVLELAPLVDPIPFGGAAHQDHDHVSDHDHGELDPHFHLDPMRMAEAVTLVAAALGEVAPDRPWDERAAGLQAEIEDLHADIEETLAPIPPERRKLITDHDALGYFADRYGFEVAGTITGASTLAEPSASSLAGLAALLREEGVNAIFVDTTASTALAETVAAELDNVEIHPIYTGSLGEPGSGAETYAAMMRTNAETIAAALAN